MLRRMLAGGALAAGGLLAYAWRLEPTWVETVRRLLPIPNLPLALTGFRVVQLSDLHVGCSCPAEYLRGVVERVNRLTPDVVVVTGDIVHHGRAERMALAGELLAGLRAGDGVFAVLGNHDWGAMSIGQGLAQWADRISKTLIPRGIQVLRNESVAIRRAGARLHLVGLDDYWGGSFRPQAAFASVPSDEPCIALVHNPDAFVEILDRPASWTLAGHTHGGQVCLPLVGPPVMPVRHRQFVAGAYELAGKRLYVNRGIGWLRRVRFNARPEITEFTLTSA